MTTHYPLSYYSSLITNTDVESLQLGLQQLEDRLFVTRESLEDKINQCFSDSHRPLIQKCFQPLANTQDPLILKQPIEALRDDLKVLPRLSIAFAQEVSYKVLKRVATWLEANLGTKVILDPSFDPSLLAGIALLQKGSYRDYSLRRRLEDMANRGELRISQLFGE